MNDAFTEQEPQANIENEANASSESEQGANEATLAEEKANGTAQADARYQQLQDQFTRLAADFDNYRKRTREEQESLIKYGAQKSLMELLPALDNLERANANLNENSDPKVLYKSFEMMQKQLLDGLNAMGLTKIQSVGQAFDPQLHEAINRMNSQEFPEDHIIYEAQSGYKLHDKVIRPAMVVVSTGSGSESSAEGSNDGASTQDEAVATSEKKPNPFAK